MSGSKPEQHHIELLANEFAICSAFHEIEPDVPLDVRLAAHCLGRAITDWPAPSAIEGLQSRDQPRVFAHREIAQVVSTSPTCQKCARRHVVSFRVEPEEAWKVVVLNRWRVLCALCFDAEAEKAGVRYSFVDLEGQSWSDRPAPRNPHKRKR